MGRDKKEQTLKDIVDGIFTNFEETAKKNERIRQQQADESAPEFDRALNHAIADIEDFHEAFMNFQTEIEHLKITEYFGKEIAQVAANGQFLESVIHGEFESINKIVKSDESEDLEEFRAKLLADVFKYYEGDAPF